MKRKNSTADLQRRSLRKATHHGLPWADDDVARIVAGIERDETSFEMALAVGRSYYSTMSARSKVAFALRHAHVLESAVRFNAGLNRRTNKKAKGQAGSSWAEQVKRHAG